MKKNIIFFHHSIYIEKPREVVWDYTQNYENRTEWDNAITQATLVETRPHRKVKIKTAGKTTMTFVYKLDDRPNKTSLATIEVESAIVESGGGSWTYEAKGNGTLWIQTNTIILKNNFLMRLVRPLFKLILTRQTKKAMVKAKEIIEQL